MRKDCRSPMAPVTTPRYRYREEAPEVISVPAGELVARLPEELRGESGEKAEPGRLIDLPCAEILRGNVPRISLGRLGELTSGLIRVPEGRDPAESITLPPGWIALHFRMVTRREELPPEPAKEETPSDSDLVAIEPSEPTEAVPPKGEVAPVEVPLVEAEPVSPAVATPSNASKESEVVTIVSEETKEDQEEPLAPTKEQPAAPKKGFFASLPIFRRTEAQEKTPAPVPATTPLEPAELHGSAKPVKEPSAPPSNKELVPSAPALERLWKLDPQDELADGSALQALFMTDEKLTLEKVVSKAGELPGLDACVLAHGDRVICASKAPAGTDLQTLSGQAMTMLSQIRDSSEKMGLGAVPAVTLHADRGVISFLHRGELCLLILHADRGFVPGVRERLQEMLGHLSEARPALPSSPAP
jgi:predicted regulator of Ras-like GTPase activity (Roadblock/LC7/MglB family)